MTSPTHLRRLGGVAAGVVAALAVWMFLTLGARAASMPVPGSDALVAAAPLNATIALSIHDADHASVTSVDVGEEFHARVRVSSATLVPTGSVSVSVWRSGDCTGASTGGETKALADGVAHLTVGFVANPSGTWSVRARYNGSGLFNPAITCKVLTVNKVAPRITFAIHDSAHASTTTAFVDQELHARARVTGSVGEVNGDVRFTRSDRADCGDGTDFNRRPLRDESVESIVFTIPQRGTEYFRARYLGDDQYTPINGPCIAITAGKAPSTVAFTVHDDAHQAVTDPVPLSTWLHPWVRLSGPTSEPSGWMDLRLYTGTSCTGTPSVTSTVIHGGFHTDVEAWFVRRSAPTDLAWQVHYRGNDAYEAKTSACRVLRWRATPDYLVQAHLPGHARVVGSVPAGTPVHLFVNLSGDFGKPRGFVEIRSFSDGDCSEGMESSGDLSFQVGGGGLDAASFTRTRATAGQRSFRAIFKADADSGYFSRTLPCVAVTFAAPAPTATPPQPSPTPTPTTRPRPSPTVVAEATPAATPTGTAAPPTTGATGTPPPGSAAASITPGQTPPPATEVPPAASPGNATPPGASPNGSPAAAATPAPSPSDSPTTGGMSVLLLVILLVAIGIAAGTLAARRRRRSTAA